MPARRTGPSPKLPRPAGRCWVFASFTFRKFDFQKQEMAMRYGYTRVSTAKQDCSNQIDALKAAGCTTIFTERVSAKSTNNRTEFNRLMRALKPGDTVVVTKLDRLARVGICTTSSTTVCGFISFGETWRDTTAPAVEPGVLIFGGVAPGWGGDGENTT